MANSLVTEPAAAVLDGPIDKPPDSEEFVRAAMEWHFSRATGSRFWLDRAGSLDFDPRADVKSLDDLTLFPNVAKELRDVPVRDLIPRGYGSEPDIVGAFESGGTTGAPKRVIYLQDWVEQSDSWVSACMDAHDLPRGLSWLSTTPTGPHTAGHAIARLARRRGGIHFYIDLDPRWVKRTIVAGHADQAASYFEHLIEQTEQVLGSQDVGILATTPPLLEKMVLKEETAEILRRKVKAILWSGAHMDPDTGDILRAEVLPGIPLIGVYGNTLILSGVVQRPGADEDGMCIFDPPAPWIAFSVVNAQTSEPVPYGKRGRLVTHHLSRSFLLPNNLERDLATRVQPPNGAVSDSVADIAPATAFDDEEVVEGVY